MIERGNHKTTPPAVSWKMLFNERWKQNVPPHRKCQRVWVVSVSMVLRWGREFSLVLRFSRTLAFVIHWLRAHARRSWCHSCQHWCLNQITVWSDSILFFRLSYNFYRMVVWHSPCQKYHLGWPRNPDCIMGKYVGNAQKQTFQIRLEFSPKMRL